jgi:hypothetical protein
MDIGSGSVILPNTMLSLQLGRECLLARQTADGVEMIGSTISSTSCSRHDNVLIAVADKVFFKHGHKIQHRLRRQLLLSIGGAYLIPRWPKESPDELV